MWRSHSGATEDPGLLKWPWVSGWWGSNNFWDLSRTTHPIKQHHTHKTSILKQDSLVQMQSGWMRNQYICQTPYNCRCIEENNHVTYRYKTIIGTATHHRTSTCVWMIHRAQTENVPWILRVIVHLASPFLSNAVFSFNSLCCMSTYPSACC
jgi:hypothetical protein